MESAPSSSRLARVRGRLELPLVRRATGMLDGRHRSVFIGHGQDFNDLSSYRPGDDVSDIDWKASARLGQPVIKRYQRESNLPLVLAVDTGRTMAAQTPTGEDKRDLVQTIADILTYLARTRGDTIALVAGDASGLDDRPARSGAQHAETLLTLLARRLDALVETTRTVDAIGADSAGAGSAGSATGTGSTGSTDGPDGAAAPEPAVRPQAPASDLAALLERVSTWHRRRSLVALITDTAHPDPAVDPRVVAWLRRLSAQHELMVIQVADDMPLGPHRRRDIDLDVEVPAFLREDQGLADRLGAQELERRARVSAALDARHIEHTSVAGDAELVDRLAGLLARQRLATSRRRR